MISQDSIDGLKSRLDIVDVVGNYVELKKAGSNYKGLCPFHDEKSPSFNVSPQKQIYHCFGCGAGGDAIKFVMEYEKLSYPEAIEKLAEQYNYTLHYTSNAPKQQRSQLLEKLNDYYQNLLDHRPEALAYLKERGIFDSSIERFGIGYAPSSQQTLTFIRSNLFTMQEAIELGVAGSDGGRSFARFIERITFPIHAPNGTIVGFGGRTISGHVAKYVNSPQTRLFNKSRLLYAYHLAKEAIYKRKEMIVTEGYLDVVMLHQAGFTNAVATLGTALTTEHLPLLRKGDPRVIMAYDGDQAGRNAALKAARLLSAAGFDGGVILFEGGLDPADMVKSGQTEALGAMLRAPQPFIEFVLEEVIASYNLQDPRAKEQAMQECTGYLKTLSPLMQEEYKRFIGVKISGVSASMIRVGGQGAAPQGTAPVRRDSHRDVWELSLIKTVIEHPEMTGQILDFIDPSLLQYHAHEFGAVLQGRIDDPRVMAVAVDDSIPAFPNDKALRAELITFLTRHYERELKKINMQHLPFEKKAFLIRSYREKIARLKRGELVPLDG
jgi:DNA primase